MATAVVNGIEPKKKIEENEVVTDLVWTPNPNRKMATTPDQKPQTYEMTNPKATILVSASTDQKKNGATTTAKNSVRYGRNKTR